MSYLSLTPKRILVFFEEDKTSCMLPTGIVKRILGSNQTLSEGAKVEVDYEKELLYEAQILKLRGKFNIRTINSVYLLHFYRFIRLNIVCNNNNNNLYLSILSIKVQWIYSLI